MFIPNSAIHSFARFKYADTREEEPREKAYNEYLGLVY